MSGMLINLIIQLVAGAIGSRGGRGLEGPQRNGRSNRAVARLAVCWWADFDCAYSLLSQSAGTMDIGAPLAIAGGSVAGALLTAIVGLIKTGWPPRSAEARRPDNACGE
jgi:hypothetical protein